MQDMLHRDSNKMGRGFDKGRGRSKGGVDQRERLLEVRNDFLNSFSSLSSCVAFAFNRIGVYSIVKLHFHLYIEDGHGRVDAGHEGEA